MSGRQRQRRRSRRQEHSTRITTPRRLVVAGGLTAGATLAMSGVAQAAPMTFHVGTNADPGSGTATDCTSASNTDCSLRRAIDLANTNADTGDKILFNSSLSGSTIDLDSGSGQLPTITTGLSIQGPGASQLTIDAASSNSRILDIDLDSKYQPVSISGLTLTNGSEAVGVGGAVRNNDADLTLANALITDSAAADNGGGVYSKFGPLTINSSTVSGNQSYRGGGIGSKYGDVRITNSTVSGNTAYGAGAPDHSDGYGGGMWIYKVDLTIDRSTVNGNVAHDGAGVYMNETSSAGGAILVKNSTIANNHAATDDGGGIWSNGSASTFTMIGSTVTGNTSLTDGGGLEIENQTDPVLRDSIVSGNISGDTPATDDLESSGSYPFDTSFSLIGVPTAAYVNTTVPGSNLFSINPQLGPLANNGGPTLTRLPADSSPVVNKGKSFGLTTDQRGLTRPVAFPGVANSTAAGADGADIGAVELQLTPTPPPGGGTTTPPVTHKKKCKKKKHKRSAQSSKKKKCKKKKKK